MPNSNNDPKTLDGNATIVKNAICEDNTQIKTLHDDQWKTAQGKRNRDSPPKNMQTKQAKLDNYWLSINTENKFSTLEIQNDNEEQNNVTEKQEKPPPIFVDRVDNISPLIQLLNDCSKDSYELKVLSSNRVKIQAFNPEHFSVIVKKLDEINTELYTCKSKIELNFKVILKNMHHSFDTKDICEELQELGHIVKNIWNIKQRQTSKPLPMFVVELEPKSTNKDIYCIKSLLHSRVTFEPPRPVRQVPQCGNCQQYGHTKTYCHRSSKCIKCADNHKSKDCTKTMPSKDVKCVLCSGNHPANYKGCSVYQEIKKQKAPFNKNFNERPTNLAIEKPKTIPSITTIPTTTYAEALRNSKNSTPENSPTNNLIVEMREMISMMKQMMGQITAMTNLLITLMPKISQCP